MDLVNFWSSYKKFSHFFLNSFNKWPFKKNKIVMFSGDEVIKAYSELSERCLSQAAAWIMNFIVNDSTTDISEISIETKPHDPTFLISQELFSLGQFQKVAYNLKDCRVSDQSSIGLKFLSKLLDTQREIDQKVPDNASFLGALPVSGNSNYESFASLIQEMTPLYESKQLDPLNLYIYAAILSKGGRFKDAVPILIESINGFPLNKSAFNLLLSILLRFDTNYILRSIESFNPQIINHWMTVFFKIELFSEIQKADEVSLNLLDDVLKTELKVPRVSAVIALEARVHYHRNDFDLSQSLFEELRKVDPLHLETLELYSNILFVKEDIVALSELSQSLSQINKFRPETLTVSGNFYAINGHHDEAISNLAMAIRQDSSFYFAWTLIGHEFVELENITAALSAYSKAHEVNQHDFRAIYGIGRVYDMSKMTFHAVFHYRNAALVNPNDWRMWMALGDCYERLSELDNSLVCYKKAANLANCDIIIFYKLAMNYMNRSEDEMAAFFLEKFVNLAKTGKSPPPKTFAQQDRIKEVMDSFNKLAMYYTSIGNNTKAEEISKRQNEFESDFSDIDPNSSSTM